MDKNGQRKTKIDNIWHKWTKKNKDMIYGTDGQKWTKMGKIWHRWTKMDKDRQNMANEARKAQRKDKTKI